MKNIFQHIFNKCKQYTNRMFYTCTSNIYMLHYTMLFSAISSLNRFVDSKVRNEEPFITLISSNILFKSIVFLYCFFTGTKLIMISPKFTISEIANAVLSRRNVNLLFADKEVISRIESLEIEERINILEFFNYIGTTLKMLEIILSVDKGYTDITLSTVAKKGRLKHLISNSYPTVSILSPGTTTESCITNVPYKLLGKSMLNLSFFMGLKPSDKVSVIADFEFFPGIYTILGLLNGIHFILPETDTELSSGEELSFMLSQSSHKPNVIFISSNNFKKIWDSILLKVYSRKWMFTLAKYWLTKWIVTHCIHKEIRNTFGKQVQKVHILNEELGFYVLDILKNSKIMFSSSYGFLEQGNFLAFKDPEVFSHRDYIYKPGGTILKETIVHVDNPNMGEISLHSDEHSFQHLHPHDIGKLIKNIPNQGDRSYLYIYSKETRYISEQPSLDLMEKSIKDTWLIRDCFLQRYFDTKYKYKLFIEIREDLLEGQMSFKEIEDAIRTLAEEFDKDSTIKVTHYAILKFNGMRNIVGKLQYYNM